MSVTHSEGTIETKCCEEVARHPFAGKKKTRARVFESTLTKDPIEAQVRDKQEIMDFFKKYPLIPYAGTNKSSGHSLQSFFRRMTYLSPTHGSCISIQKTLAFGGKIGFVKTEDPDFESLVDNDVSQADKKKYLKFLKDSVKLSHNTTWLDMAKSAFSNYKEDGNIFIKVGRFDVLGKKFGTIDVLDNHKVMYVMPETKSETRYLAISEYFTDEYLTANKPEIVPLFPEFSKSGHSIIHVKYGNGEWYGRPDSMNSFMYQYREFQDAFFLSKQADSGFVGQVIIEIEGDDPETSEIDNNEDGFNSTAERMEINFTNKGDDPSTVMLLERPFGASPAAIKQIYPSTNEKFFEKAGNIAKLKIIQSHQWSERLLGENVSGAFTNAAYLEEFSLKMPLLRSYQNVVAGAINSALQSIAWWVGADTEIGIKFISPLKTIGEYVIGDETTVPLAEAQKEAEAKKGSVDNEDLRDDNGL